MAVEAVRNYSVSSQQPTVVKKNLKPEQNAQSIPEADKEKSNAAKYMIGATVLAGVAALGIAGYKGHLGEGIQRFLGGAEKAAKKGEEVAESAAKKGEEVVNVVQEKAAKKGEEVAESATKKSEEVVNVVQEKAAKKGEEVVGGVENTSERASHSGSSLSEGAGIFEDDLFVSRGAYGQDIYDPLEPMNVFDELSPYYQQPGMANSGIGGYGSYELDGGYGLDGGFGF